VTAGVYNLVMDAEVSLVRLVTVTKADGHTDIMWQ
jgi:hypothetical protein